MHVFYFTMFSMNVHQVKGSVIQNLRILIQKGSIMKIDV